MEYNSVLDLVKIRDAEEKDFPFIFNSWLRSYKTYQDVKSVPDEMYYKGQHKVIEDTLLVSNISIAYHVDDPDHILGYIVYEYEEPTTSIIHWVFVKKPFREHGIARKLWSHATDGTGMVIHTHNSYQSIKIKDKIKSHYNPYLKIGVRI